MPINKFKGVTRSERINNIRKAEKKQSQGKSAGIVQYASRPSVKSFTSSLAPATGGFVQYKANYLTKEERIKSIIKSEDQNNDVGLVKYENRASIKSFTSSLLPVTGGFVQYKANYLTKEERIKSIIRSEKIFSKGSKGKFPGLIQYANNSSYSPTSNTAFTSSFAPTASYYQTSSLTIGSLDLLGGGSTGSFGTNIFSEITASGPVDQFLDTYGNAAVWLVSIKSGSALKTSEVVATWGSSSINFYSTEVSQIGDVPVYMSATNQSGIISLIANPSYGTWTIKLIRMMI
jgi:hypothetical protein